MFDKLMKTFVFATDQTIAKTFGHITNYVLEQHNVRVVLHADPVDVLTSSTPRANYDLLLTSSPSNVLDGYRLKSMYIPSYKIVVKHLASVLIDTPLTLPSLEPTALGVDYPKDAATRLVFNSLNAGFIALSVNAKQVTAQDLVKDFIKHGKLYADSVIASSHNVKGTMKTYDGANYVLRNENMLAETYHYFNKDINTLPTISFVTSGDTDLSFKTLNSENKNDTRTPYEDNPKIWRELIEAFCQILPALVTVRLNMDSVGCLYINSIVRTLPADVDAALLYQIRVTALNQFINETLG